VSLSYRPATAAMGAHSPYSGSLSARRHSVSRNPMIIKSADFGATHDVLASRKQPQTVAHLRSRSQPRTNSRSVAAAYGLANTSVGETSKKPVPPPSPIRTGPGMYSIVQSLLMYILVTATSMSVAATHALFVTRA
jgi:hypothetical protein